MRPHQQSPERAAFTDTVDSCHSRSPSPDCSSSPQPRKHRQRKKAKAAAEDVTASPRLRDNVVDKPETKVTKEEESPGRQQQTTGEIGPVPVKEAADTADEVSDIESEVASPGRPYGNSQLATEPEAAVSPKCPVPEVCEEQDSMPEEVGSCRGEDDALKKDVDSESRGDDEKQVRLLIMQSNDCREAVKRKGLWNENRSKPQHPSTPQTTPRSPTSPRTPRSLLVQGMELTDPSSVSSSTREECSHSSVSLSCDIHSETYTKLMQEEERALPGDVEPGLLNGYTLSGSKRVIKRSKAVKKKRRRPAPPRSVTGKEPSSVVEVEQPMKIPQLSVGAPGNRDGSSGGGQLEMVVGTEPSRREFLQDDIYILQDTPIASSHSTNLAAHTLETSEGTLGQDPAHAEKESARTPPAHMHEGTGSQCETTGDDRAVKGEKEAGTDGKEASTDGNEVPAIVVSSVPEAFISFHPPPKTVFERRLEQEVDVHERGCENVWQNEENGGRNDVDCAHVSDSAGYGPENYIRKSCNMDTSLQGNRRTMGEEGDERKGDAVINIVCQEPDSPPADNAANNMDAEISISRVRRLSVELGTEEESIVLAHLRRHSVDGADGGAVFPQQPGLAADAADHSGEDITDGGQRFQRRRQSSLTVPLEAEALKLADRWVTEQDFPKQPKRDPCHQKKTVTWTQASDQLTEASGHEDEPKDTVSNRNVQERDVQADLEEHPGEQGIRVYVHDKDHDAAGDSGEIFSKETSGNVNKGKEGEPPVADDLMNIDNNMVEPGMDSTNGSKSSQKDNAEDLYNDNDFENDDSKSSSSSASTSSSSSSSNSWTSDSSSSSSTSDSDSSSSSTSQASSTTLKSTAPPGKATGPKLSVLSVAECLMKNRGLKTGQQVNSDSTPHLHPMTSPTPGSKAAEHGHTPESENETSDLDRSITKENDLQKETQNQNSVELSPQATDSKDNDEQLNIQTISTSFPTVVVSYHDVQVFDDDGQKVVVKNGADDKEERSDVDSACDAKTASTTSLKGSVAKLVDEEEEKATKKEKKRKEDFRTMEVEERGEESEELSPTAPVGGQEEGTRGGDDGRTQPVKVINGTDREIDDYSSDNSDEDHKGKQINVENIEADDPVKIHHRTRTSSSSSHSSSTAPPTANLSPEEERGTDNTIINVDLVDREERGEEKTHKENQEREELRQKEEEEFLEQQRHEREERRASVRRASEVKRQEALYQQQLLEAEQSKRERQKKVERKEETIPSQDAPEEKRRQVMMVLEETDSDSQQQSAPERRQEAAAKPDRTELTAEVRQDVEDWEGNGGRYLQKVEEREDEEEESSEQGRPGDSNSHSQSSTARSLSPAPLSASSESSPQQRDVEDSKGLQAPDHSEMEPRRSASPAPAVVDSLTVLAPDQGADADMEPPRAPSPFPPPAVYLHRRQTRTEENAHPARAESPPSTGPLSPTPLTSEPAQFRPLSPAPPRAESDAPSEPPPRATSPFPSPAVYVDRPKRRPDAEPNVEGEQDRGRSHHTETSHSLASSTLSTTIVTSDPEDEPNTEDAGAHGGEGKRE